MYEKREVSMAQNFTIITSIIVVFTKKNQLIWNNSIVNFISMFKRFRVTRREGDYHHCFLVTLSLIFLKAFIYFPATSMFFGSPKSEFINSEFRFLGASHVFIRSP